jgi:hypothetical protein
MSPIVRDSGQVQGLDCSARANRTGFSRELTFLSLPIQATGHAYLKTGTLLGCARQQAMSGPAAERSARWRRRSTTHA